MRLTHVLFLSSCFVLSCFVGCGSGSSGPAVEPTRGALEEYAANNPEAMAAQAAADRQAEIEESGDNDK